MNDEPLQYTQVDITDTIPPPPPKMPQPRKARARTYPVTVRCENEQQRAMLIDWLAEAGFDIESRTA